MMPGKLSRTVNYGIAIAVIFGGALRAEQPAPEPAAAQQAKLPAAGAPTTVTPTYVPKATVTTTYSPVNVTYFTPVVVTHRNPFGVEIAELDAALRTQLGIEDEVGVVVTGVKKDSSAAKAGLEPFDLVLEIGEQKIVGTKQFHELLESQQGKSVTSQIVRKAKPMTLTFELANTPVYRMVQYEPRYHTVMRRTAQPKHEAEVRVEKRQYRIGVTLSQADETLRSQLRLSAGEGLVVTDVMTDSPAAKAGIQKNDVMTRLDDKRLTTSEAANAIIQKAKDRKLSVTLFRAGSETTLDVTPQLTSDPNPRSVKSDLDELIRHRIREKHDVDGAAIGDWLRYNERHDALRWLRSFVDEKTASAADAAVHSAAVDQLAELKKQFAELQMTLARLEAALQTAPKEQPAAPQEKK